ncbi:MAG: hypothetical protein HOJ61_08120 [Gammaproteobacteria bacterium]|nr:hypothetical protein [Gammaproteobacteria bacterium]MBT5602189.1 hypothetical protein [Gammaproteobacteria bacterium]MBT6246152.1 hypothetical protein [Gammaproteobacteria bacterium]
MAKIIGNIRPEDDYTHELGPEANFNESVYFNFFDRQQSRGGFVRIGNRANEGYAEVTVIVWNPDGSAYFNYAKPDISDNDSWNAGGLTIDVQNPGERVRTLYTGEPLFMSNPLDMKDPGKAFKANPRRPIKLDLIHTAVGPLYGHVGKAGDGNEFARSHSEQHMSVAGTLTLADEEPIRFSGWGLRDHSWGPRFWQATPSYRWITGNFGDDLGMVITTNGDGVGRGLFQQGSELIRMKSAVLTTEYLNDSRYHSRLTADIVMQDGAQRKLTGRVMGYIPLRNRRSGANTYVGEGMTEYTLDDGRVGYGLSEYLDQPNS